MKGIRIILACILLSLLSLSSVNAQFKNPNALDFCENSESIRETWLVIDVSSNSIPEDWVKQVIPSLRSGLHSRERLVIIATDSATKRTLPTVFDECFVSISKEEQQKLDTNKSFFEKWITDSSSDLRGAQQAFDFKLASALEGLLTSINSSEKSSSYFPLLYPLFEDIRLSNINSDTKRFLRVVFLGFPFQFDAGSQSLIESFNSILAKYPVGSMEIHIVAEDEKSTFKNGKSLSEYNELVFLGLGATVRNVNSALLIEPGKRIQAGYASSGYWEYEDTKSGDTAELYLFKDATGRVEHGKITMQSIVGYTSVPVRGTIQCKDLVCKFTGEVASDVPVYIENDTDPSFFTGDPVDIDIDGSPTTARILAGGSKTRDTSAHNIYLINFGD